MDGKIKLDDSEEVLVCGTRKSVAWRTVPLLQAQYQLNVILQNQGYLNARFEIDNEHLKVWKGPVTKTKKLVLTGTNGIVNARKKRKVVGEALTPNKLDEVIKWAELASRRQGHACPKVTAEAQAWDRKIIANIEPGKKQTIRNIFRTGYGSLDESTLRRFEAFESGDKYDVVDTQITTDRIMAQGLFQNAYITAECDEEEVDLHLITEIGKHRLVRFNIGASTEEFPFVDMWFKNSRLDNRASSFTAQVHASPIRQSVELNSEFYVFPESYRSYLGPRFKVERKRERVFESNNAELGGDIGRRWDMGDVRLQGRVGPTLNYTRTLVGEGPPELTYLSYEGSIDAMSHAYEAFTRTQFEGWNAGFDYSGQRSGLGSSLNIDRFDLRLKTLWNVNKFSPPLFIFASRFEGIFVNPHHHDTTAELAEIPTDLRIFYGGNDNIRGFNRQVLNNNELGYLSAALASFEIRVVEVAPWNLEPFVLADFAKLGDTKYEFLAPTFFAGGGGVRWASPFGTLRVSAARGQIWNNNASTANYPQEWVFFFSFGTEF